MIVIDGNIGSGKTTQLDLLEQKGFKVKREPIDKWPLQEFYDDPKRWSFYFHMVILKTQQSPTECVICERSLYSSRFVFWPILLRDGTVTANEDETYQYFWDKLKWCPELFIYLDKDPKLSHEHIQKRGQSGDTQISLEYLEKLDAEYKKLVLKIPCRVVVVNANRPAEDIHNEICQILGEYELLISDSIGQKV